jgi:hypothetical protein
MMQMVCVTSWPCVLTGQLEELYWNPEPGVMHVKSTIFVGDKSLGTTQVMNWVKHVTVGPFTHVTVGPCTWHGRHHLGHVHGMDGTI